MSFEERWKQVEARCAGPGELVQATISPSATYSINITQHSTGQGSWKYAKAVITDRNDQQVAEWCHNYPSLPFGWAEGHPQGDFILTSTDYQSFALVDLATGIVETSRNPGAKNGGGWCPAQFHISPCRRWAAAIGCIWACPYSLRIYDIRKVRTMPWPLLYEDYEQREFVRIEWDEKGATVVFTEDFVDWPGHPTDGLSEFAAAVDDLDGEEYDQVVDHFRPRQSTKAWVAPS